MSTSKPLRDLHVLVVDDDDDTREVFSAVLRAYGANVTIASGGLEAAALLKRRRIDCLVSDINMPDHDGLWLIREVRRDNGHRPLAAVAVTALVGPEARRLILGAGYHAHLPKPVDPPLLVDAVLYAVSRCRQPSQ